MHMIKLTETREARLRRRGATPDDSGSEKVSQPREFNDVCSRQDGTH